MAAAVMTHPQSSSPVLEGLQPHGLWTYFGQLSAIPRPSKHEEKVIAWLIEIAEKKNLKWKQDPTGNIVICRPGSGGGENAPTVIIQGHMDMVTEKNKEIAHDFFKDPIRLKRKGDWLHADGTTLGADNGIGVAAGLALLDCGQEVKLPPLELLVTVDEETGLTGAFGLDASILTGKTMLNLDTEDWNEIFIGCAGGGDSVIRLPVTFEKTQSSGAILELSVTGLLGGHSGLNIGEGRGNAVKMLAQSLAELSKSIPQTQLIQLSGGDKRNALAREAYATILIPGDKSGEAQKVVGKVSAQLKEEYGLKEAQLKLDLKASENTNSGNFLSTGSFQKLLSLLLILPHGVAKMSHAVDGLVETSNNVAAVALEGDDKYKIIMSSRSSIGSALKAQQSVILRAAESLGASVVQEDAYPGWAPNPSSKVVQLTAEVMETVSGSKPTVGAIHAGLECGLLGAKVPGLDMVSYGPTIRGAHSPDECVQISTVQPFWDTTLKLLGRLADRKI